MGSSQSKRFQMLIEITSKGGPELQKLGASAKKMQKIFSHLDRAIEKTEQTTQEGRSVWKTFAASLKGVMSETNKYTQAQLRLRKEMKKANPNPANIEKYKAAMVASKSAARGYAKTLNQLVPGMAKLDFRAKNAGLNFKMLAKAQGEAKARATTFTSSITKASRQKKKDTAETKKNTSAIKANTAATKKNEFATNNMRQRLDTTGSSTFAKMRRQVGAIRNQILLLTFATVALRNAFNKAFDAANELEAAMKGLGAVASNTGNDMVKAQEAAQKLSDKGLLSVQDSAAGLKNLLSAGFGLKEAISLMDTLTDSASFNRQGTLSLGQAVVGATQGIKNQNSIMVDNAGITKNLSIMYKEYASTIGTSAGKLDEAQKRQAIFNGILKEGQIFAGDAEKVVLTMSGALTKLGVNSEKAAAQMGKLTQPMATGFVQAFAIASDNILKFGEALEKNPEFMQRMISMGYQLEESIRYVNAILGKLFTFMSKVNNGMGGMIMAFVKGAAILKLYRLRVAASASAAAKLEASHLQVVKASGLHSIATKKEITLYQLKDKQLWKTLSLRKRYRIELDRLIMNEQALTGAVVKGTAMQKLKNQAMRTATHTAKGASLAMGMLRAGINGVKTALGPLLIAFLAFEAVVWVFKKITEWLTGVEKQTDLNRRRNEELTASYQRQFQSVANGYYASVEAANAFTDTQLMGVELAQKYIKVEQEFRNVLRARAEYAKAVDAEQAAAAQMKIDAAMDSYNLEMEGLKGMQGMIQSRTNDHLEKLLAANVAYNEELAVKQKARGVDDIIEARQHLVTRLKQYEDFQHAYGKLTQKAQNDPKNAQKLMRMDEAVEMARKNLQLEREKTLGTHYDKMLDIRQKYEAKLYEYNANDIDRIKGQWASKRKIEEEKLKEHFDAMKNLAEGAYLSSQEDYISNVGTNVIQAGNVGSKTARGAAYSEDSFGQIGDELGGKGWGKQAEAIGKTYDKLTAAQAEYKSVLWDSNATTEDLNNSIGSYKDSLTLVRGELIGNMEAVKENKGQESIAYQNMETNLDQIDSLIGVLHTAGKEYAVLKDEKASMDKQVATGTEAYEKALKVLQDSMTIEEKRALGAAYYKEDLKELAVKYKELALAIQGTVDVEGNLTGALAKNVHGAKTMANITNKYAHSQQTLGGAIKEFFNPLQNSEKLLRKQAEATENLATKQILARQAHQDKLTLAGLELKAEKEILTKGIDSGKYTDQQVKDQEKRIEASQAKVDALYAEGVALNKLNQIEADVLKDQQQRDRDKEKIDKMTKYAEFFSNFTTQMQSLEHKRLMSNMQYQKKLKKEVFDGVINQKQADALAIENARLTAAEKAKGEKLALAGLIRDVGRQIMVYAAKAAAESGNIPAALGMLAAGVAANAMINSYANKITREAEADYLDAKNRFDQREGEIRGDGDNQSGSANQQRFGGSIKAENLSVEINPTVVIQGEQVFIGQGSVNEFGAELQSLLLTSVNDAIENREIDLSNVSDRG